MPGSWSSIGTLPENLIFDNGSTSSSDAGVDSEISWNTMPIPAQNPLPDYGISSSGTHNQYLQHVRQNVQWCLGETSSSARQYQPYGILSSDSVGINPNGNQNTNGSFLLQSPSSNTTIPPDLNTSLEFEDQEEDDDDDDCRVIEHPESRVSIGSLSNDQIRPNGGSVVDGSEDRPGCSLDGRRVSCKRKAVDVHVGPSSGVGSSNFSEIRQWHAIPENNVGMMMHVPAEHNIVVNNGPEQANNGLRLGAARGVSLNPFSFTAPENSESSRRNLRLRVNNGLNQPDPILPENPFSPDVGNVDVSSSRHSSRLVLLNRPFDSNPAHLLENGSLHGQSALLDLPSVRRNHQSRWTAASSARSSRSFAPTAAISEHPMFVPASEMGNSFQNPTNWNLPNNNAGNAASATRVGSSRRGRSSGPSLGHRSLPQYPRRLSEVVHRSLVSSAANVSQEMGLPSGPDNNPGRHVPGSRSVVLERERHVDGAFGIPYSWRTLAAASEGRSSVMSEIRHVLDLMRRGEGLRFEDVMVLDHSVLFGMADIHDRHRDMRLDVDNMSYEELLALEERIGNVCTGLTEETIWSRLKQRRFVDIKVEDQVETEPCSICREEYKDGEDLGTLECGHDFHRDCIKQWLMHKNLCPICKTTGLTI